MTYEFCFLFLLGLKQWVHAYLPRGPTAEWSLLVWDLFRFHLTEPVKEDLRQQQIDAAVIPHSLINSSATDKCPKRTCEGSTFHG